MNSFLKKPALLMVIAILMSLNSCGKKSADTAMHVVLHNPFTKQDSVVSVIPKRALIASLSDSNKIITYSMSDSFPGNPPCPCETIGAYDTVELREKAATHWGCGWGMVTFVSFSTSMAGNTGQVALPSPSSPPNLMLGNTGHIPTCTIGDIIAYTEPANAPMEVISKALNASNVDYVTCISDAKTDTLIYTIQEP